MPLFLTRTLEGEAAEGAGFIEERFPCCHQTDYTNCTKFEDF